MRSAITRYAPAPVRAYVRRIVKRYQRAQLDRLPALDAEQFRNILTGRLGVSHGDVLFVHSSVDRLALPFAFTDVLRILRDVVGAEGTLVFPTYPKLGSADFVRSGQVFDVRRTPSFMGAITEAARRQPGAVRSLHPTKSVCAIGPLAGTLTDSHFKSPYPYDECSPYYRLMAHNGKIIGLGVAADRISFVHCADDAMKDRFPVAPYLPTLYDCVCRDYDGSSVVVSTYAHDPSKMNHAVSRFVKRHIRP